MEKELLEISDFNCVAFLSAHGISFKIEESSLLAGVNDRVEVRFQIQKSEVSNGLIADYMADRDIGIQTFLKASKLVKDVMMQTVRAARRNQLTATVRDASVSRRE